MMARTIALPIQIYSNPLWAQLIADTLPVMAYASAWTMLVSFFVRLVGVALGSGTSTTPGTVIQITAYCLYSILIGTFFFHHTEAAVLLYSLLCCIYAALLGTSLYFLPRLIFLLYPNWMQWSRSTRNLPTSTSTNQGQNSHPSTSIPGPTLSSQSQQQQQQQQRPTASSSSSSSTTTAVPKAPPELAIRLVICSGVCLFVFAARTINFANKIVSPAHTASWWWQYGALELFPSVLFLIIIRHPQAGAGSGSGSTSHRNKREDTDHGVVVGTGSSNNGRSGRKTRSFQRTDSYGSGPRPTNHTKGTTETTPLIRSSGGYGSSGGSAQSLKDHPAVVGRPR
jgi:hypothetical protein